MRQSVVLATVVIAIATVGAVVAYNKLSGKKPAAQTETTNVVAAKSTPRPRAPAPPPDEVPITQQDPAPEPPATPPAQPGVLATTAARPATVPAPGPEPSAYTRDLVASLSKIDLSSGRITPEQADAWKASLKDLVGRGAESVPAIREFLEKNLELNFDTAKDGNLLGQPSLRMSLLEALTQIGGPEAQALSLQTLRSSSEPRELAFLAEALQRQARDQYRGEILSAAREVLAQAAEGKLGGRDVGSLFGLLRQYGGAEALPDLEKATGQWRYYSVIALGDMADGAGVPSLIKMAGENNASNSRLAVQMLAQISMQYPEAQTALIESVRSKPLPDVSWITIADVLAGDRFEIGQRAIDPQRAEGGLRTFHLGYGNQNFYSLPNNSPLTEAEANRRVALIDQFIGVNPSQMAADALQKARARVLARPRVQ